MNAIAKKQFIKALKKLNNPVADYCIIVLSDSYKQGHHAMYPKGTEVVYSYFESRTGAEFDETVWFGLQYIVKRYLAGQVVTQENIEACARLFKVHFGNEHIFNREGWEYILRVHNGKLPVRIKAAPEGMVIPVSNVMMTIENTDDNCWWLTNFLETLLTHVWYTSVVATLSRNVKERVKHYYELTVDDHKFGALDFALQDFGCRGVTCMEQAGIGGMAHLVNFKGTDTDPALATAVEYYDADLECLGFSVPATEHSIMTSLGKDGEDELIQNLLDEYPTGILSVVGDSYNIYEFAKKLGTTFKQQILDRDGVFVLRPDSGDPEEVMLKLHEILWGLFGGHTNSKGYKVLNPKIRLLWGDGIGYRGIDNILGAMMVWKWSAENVACFGMGGGLLQKVNRDTQRSAFKCSAQRRNGVWVDIQKNPLDTTKKSKAGRLKLVRDAETKFKTVRAEEAGEDVLVTVFEDGELMKEWTFAEVRENAKL